MAVKPNLSKFFSSYYAPIPFDLPFRSAIIVPRKGRSTLTVS